MLVKRLEVEEGGTAEEDSPLPAYHNNLLHTQALESRSSHPTLWGKGVILDLHPTDPFPFGERKDFVWKGKDGECVPGRRPKNVAFRFAGGFH